MKLKTGDPIFFNNKVATVLEHTDEKLTILLGKVDDMNEVDVDIKKVELRFVGQL